MFALISTFGGLVVPLVASVVGLLALVDE